MNSTILITFDLVIMMSFFGKKEPSGIKSISPLEANEMLQRDSDLVVLDVRNDDEFRSESGHLSGALLIPVQELEQRADELAKLKDRTILVYCRSGIRSLKASKILSQRGFRAINIEGGILRWRNDQLPVVNET